ncbi:MAG: ribbon-helix-helix protein, CopG family [Candidatus Gastranaerophilales bacterium]|nr:ribbon-helix-helix protein, CopG family [Candidatus Gastranaerophilales bacterium]
MAKVLLSIPDKFLTQIDEVAENEQRTRSELIREALRTYMKRNTMFDLKKTSSDAELLDKLLD